MYWYKVKKSTSLLALIGLLACGMSACRSKTTPDTVKPVYFDIQGYFTAEAAKLAAKQTIIHKTVGRNEQSENKEVRIADWKKEFALFIESDINKPAWTKSYTIYKRLDTTEYISKDSTLKTLKISIIGEYPDDIKSIEVINRTSNALYTSKERLYYKPDSLYRITKQQSVRFLGESNYQITGWFVI